MEVGRESEGSTTSVPRNWMSISRYWGVLVPLGTPLGKINSGITKSYHPGLKLLSPKMTANSVDLLCISILSFHVYSDLLS